MVSSQMGRSSYSLNGDRLYVFSSREASMSYTLSSFLQYSLLNILASSSSVVSCVVLNFIKFVIMQAYSRPKNICKTASDVRGWRSLDSGSSADRRWGWDIHLDACGNYAQSRLIFWSGEWKISDCNSIERYTVYCQTLSYCASPFRSI